MPSVVFAQQAQPLQRAPTATPTPPGNPTATPVAPTPTPFTPSPVRLPTPRISLAPTPTPTPPRTIPGTSGTAVNFSAIAGFAGVTLPGSLGEVISKFVPYIFGLAGIVLFFYLIWGGFSWMMAKGDPKATAAAREKITKALVGFAIIFTAYWLTQILGLIFGISQFEDIFK